MPLFAWTAQTAPASLADCSLFAVSCTEFKSSSFSSFDPAGRQDAGLVAGLEARGLDSARATVLFDRAADTKRVDYEFRERLAKVRPGETLVVFTSTHGYRQNGQFTLATWNAEVGCPGWRMPRAFAQVKRLFKGARIVWIADLCGGGELRGFLSGAPCPTLLLSSASGNESTREGWGFQQALVEGLTNGFSGWDSLGRAAVIKWGQGAVWSSAP